MTCLWRSSYVFILDTSFMVVVSVCMASMYGGQLPGIGLYGYLSIMGGALYMYPCLASVYVDGVCCLCVLYVFHSFDFISFSRVVL
jgi:hypothetical protein